MSRTARIVRAATIAAYVVGLTGVAVTLASGLFMLAGEPWGVLTDVAVLVMTAAIAPLMLAFYELGGLTPTPLAQVAQAAGWIAVLTWCAAQALVIAGVVEFDLDSPADGAFGIWSAALVVIGSWVAGANLLAGPWLGRVRWVGVVGGLAGMALGYGLLLGRAEPLSYIGLVIYQFGIPIWALLMTRELGRHSRSQLIADEVA